MTENFANLYSTTLSAAITSTSATTLTVVSATGAPSANFRILIGTEYMLVTNVSSLTFTVTRGIEGSTAATHPSGAVVTHILTSGGLVQGVLDAALIGCVAYHNTTQAITASTNTVVAYNSEDFDTSALHDTSTNNGRITIPSGLDGYWRFDALTYAASSPSGIVTWFRKNGASSPYVRGSTSLVRATASCTCFSSAIVSLVATDYIEVIVFITNSINIGDASNAEQMNTLRATFVGR